MRNDLKSLLQVLMQIELEEGLFSIEFGGVPWWWFARQKLFALLASQITKVDYFEKAPERLSATGKLAHIRESISLRPKTIEVDVLALSTASARRHLTEDGKAFDVYFDFLSEFPHLKYAVMEFPDNGVHSQNPFSQNVIYGDWITLLGNIGRYVHRFTSQGFTKRVASLLEDRLKKYGIRVIDAQIESLLNREIGFIKYTAGLARRILERINPEVLLVECGYSASHMIFQHVAKRMHIPVIELQHGIIGNYAPGYFFGVDDSSLVRKGPFPDRLLVYGAHFERILRSNSSLDIRVVGNPYLWLNHRNSNKEHRRRGILITSQPGLGKFWAQFARQLSAVIDEPICIKPHPSEYSRSKDIFAEADKVSGVSIILNRGLYDLFSEVRYHLSVSSTSHLEAIAFGVGDIVVAKDGFESPVTFLHELNVPVATSVEDVAEFLQKFPDQTQAHKYVVEEVFTLNNNPIEAIAKELNVLL